MANATDVFLFLPDLLSQTSTPGSGTDINCDGVINASDVGLFIPQLDQGFPRP